jgi:hypothetical protein
MDRGTPPTRRPTRPAVVAPKALHKYDMSTVRLRHQSRVSALAEVKTGPRGTVILPCSPRIVRKRR